MNRALFLFATKYSRLFVRRKTRRRTAIYLGIVRGTTRRDCSHSMIIFCQYSKRQTKYEV